MKKEEQYFTRFVLEDGKMKKVKVRRDEALKDIKEVLKEDREFLEVMAKM